MFVNQARNIQRNLIDVSSELPAARPERMFTLVIDLKNASADEINNNCAYSHPRMASWSPTSDQPDPSHGLDDQPATNRGADQRDRQAHGGAARFSEAAASSEAAGLEVTPPLLDESHGRARVSVLCPGPALKRACRSSEQ
ncbi:MAG: hypothetical protein HC902_04465 [Calothrix sp. SM1_5_4]|nr:hypothetical protein [Calothrix sp. SM1_5_4]